MSSHWLCSVKKGVLKNFANFTENHLCWSLSCCRALELWLYQKETSTQVFSYGIGRISKNIYFEEHLRMTAFSSSSFKLDLVDLTVFPDSNLRLAKINKPLTTYAYQNFHVSAVTPLLSHVIKLKNYRTLFFSFIFNELTSKVTDVSVFFL